MSTAVVPADRSEAERLKSFGRALHELKTSVEAEMGEVDVRRVKRLDATSRALEVAGRVLLHFSVGPVSFLSGVGALWAHKQLQATEIGHPVLHGCYDGLPGAERYHSERFSWDIPIDEEAWREGHNLRHHGFTNVDGKDPDISFGPVRLTDQTPHQWFHYLQLPYTLVLMWPGFAAGMNMHFTGMFEVFSPEPELLPDTSWGSKLQAFKRTFRKYIPYYAKNYVFFPALAGPFFWKVLLGNILAERGRDLYMMASIFCGHIGEEVECYEAGSKPRGRGGWYERQCRATQNFEVPYLLSVFCGGLDYQIEHHLFPRMPPERLRQIAPQVRRICAEHGVPYRTGSWAQVLGIALTRVWNLSFPTPAEVAA